MLRTLFLLAFTWLTALNYDNIVKGFAIAGSIATMIAAYSTIKKNRRQ